MAQVNILNLPVRIALTGLEYIPGQAASETTQRFTTGQIAALAGTPSIQIQISLDTIGATQGDILYRGATAWNALPPSTAGFVLSTQGPSANPTWVSNSLSAVRVVTASGAVTVAVTDYLIVVNKTVAAATTVNLYATPGVGSSLIIKDGKGDANVNNITITPAAGLIDGSASYVLVASYQAATLVYNGTSWSVV